MFHLRTLRFLYYISLCLTPFLASTFMELIARPLTHRELQNDLEEAIEIAMSQRSGRMVRSVDPNERYEANFGIQFLKKLIHEQSFDVLFRIADEAFEAEFDKGGGATRGPQQATAIYQDNHQPPPLQPIHIGELGGLDGTSCRSCHFSGGPDGSGSGSQLTLLRGDGKTLSSAMRRDPPHVMGLGYVTLMAREIQQEIEHLQSVVQSNARSLGQEYSIPFKPKGIDFGELRAGPDGSLDTSKVKGISKDLKLRPFGWKGRHADLVELCDEALQVHHGLQSLSRIHRFLKSEHSELYLGKGSQYDPDEDGKQLELNDGQGIAMAAYLSLLGAPTIKAPHSPRLALSWAHGRALFDSIGCAECHRSDLRFRMAPIRFTYEANDLMIDLNEGGQAPKLRSVDFSPIEDGSVLTGIPLIAFTDFRRHDMGPALAEPIPETLPDGGGEVPGSMWLTRSLWGLADTAPYLHDGRAQTVEEAILWHGGEAEPSRKRYEALSATEQGAVRMYLMSFTRAATVLVE